MNHTPVKVESASTTPHPAGGVVLLVCTEAGRGRLHFPESLARQLFVVTNRPEWRKPAPNLSEQAAAGAPLVKPSGALA